MLLCCETFENYIINFNKLHKNCRGIIIQNGDIEDICERSNNIFTLKIKGFDNVFYLNVTGMSYIYNLCDTYNNMSYLTTNINDQLNLVFVNNHDYLCFNFF